MPNTRGFEIVAELTPGLLTDLLRGAWDSGGDPAAPGTVPHSFDIPPGTMLGGYVLSDGQAQIPRDGLDVTLAPSVNGVDLKLGLEIQVTLQDPPVPSASMLTLTADVHARAPVGPTGTDIDVGILFGSLTPADVTAALTNDPIAPNIDNWIVDFVHALYASGKIPSTMQQTDAPVGPASAYLVDATADVYDDSSNPARTINVTRPDAGHVAISIPVHLRVFNIRRQINYAPALADPMGIVTRVNVTLPLIVDAAAGQISVDVSSPVVTTDPIAAPPVPDYPAAERNNYNYNKGVAASSILSIDLDAALSQQLIAQTRTMVQALTGTSFSLPTTGEIEATIASQSFDQLVTRGSVSVWTPDTADGITVTDVQTRALADALAIALNAGAGADATALTNFVPAGAGFAIAMNGAKVLALINDAIHRPEAEGGFGPGFPPHRFHVDDHDVDLTRLDISLTSAIHLSGDVTVIDAIAGSIDVDAGFDDDVGLHWETNADGSQTLKDDAGDPDVHLSAAAWILSLIIGFVTFGVVGAIVAFVVLEVVQSTASNLGGAVVRNAANQVTGVGAWPSQLRGIGTIDSAFENPVGISPDGLLFRG